MAGHGDPHPVGAVGLRHGAVPHDVVLPAGLRPHGHVHAGHAGGRGHARDRHLEGARIGVLSDRDRGRGGVDGEGRGAREDHRAARRGVGVRRVGPGRRVRGHGHGRRPGAAGELGGVPHEVVLPAGLRPHREGDRRGGGEHAAGGPQLHRPLVGGHLGGKGEGHVLLVFEQPIRHTPFR